jgi:pullulanase/glycogen debranching enzyme
MWLRGTDDWERSLLVLLNSGDREVDFTLPAPEGAAWRLALSSAQPPTRDVIPASLFRLASQSVAVLQRQN